MSSAPYTSKRALTRSCLSALHGLQLHQVSSSNSRMRNTRRLNMQWFAFFSVPCLELRCFIFSRINFLLDSWLFLICVDLSKYCRKRNCVNGMSFWERIMGLGKSRRQKVCKFLMKIKNKKIAKTLLAGKIKETPLYFEFIHKNFKINVYENILLLQLTALTFLLVQLCVKNK